MKEVTPFHKITVEWNMQQNVTFCNYKCLNCGYLLHGDVRNNNAKFIRKTRTENALRIPKDLKMFQGISGKWL